MKNIDKKILYYTNITTPVLDMVAFLYDNKIVSFTPSHLESLSKKVTKLKKILNCDTVQENKSLFVEFEKELNDYFNGKIEHFSTPFLLFGTPFQKKCWEVLLKIPYGQTISYKEQAKLVGNEKAFRAVANANGKNELSIIIPCHRVVASNGKLGGYTGGIEVKEYLLDLEKENR